MTRSIFPEGSSHTLKSGPDSYNTAVLPNTKYVFIKVFLAGTNARSIL